MDSLGSPEGMEGIYQETVGLLARIVETGGAMDPFTLTSVRQSLRQHFYMLGVTNRDGSLNTRYWMDFTNQLARRKDTPIKPKGYPDRDAFTQKFIEVTTENPTLIADVSPRGSTTIEDYLYGVGMVMANKLVYESIFDGDPIVYRNGEVQNGRHRVLTQQILGRCGFSTTWPWVQSEIEHT